MKGLVKGTVVQVEHGQPRVNEQGQRVQYSDVYLAGDNPRFGADRISMRTEIAPQAGETVAYAVLFTAKRSKAGREYLSAYAVDRLDPEYILAQPVAALAAVAGG